MVLSIQAENDLYSRPSIRVLTGEVGNPLTNVELRASAINSCPRQLWYEINGEPHSDEIPARSKRMLDMGRSLEGIGAQALVDQGYEVMSGWEIIPMGADLLRREMSPIDSDTRWQITGLPDFVARPAGSDDTEWRLVEIKSRSADAFRKVVNEQNLSAQPGAVMQLAAYRLTPGIGVYEADDLHSDSIIVTLNRSDGDIHIEHFKLETLQEILQQVNDQWTARLSQWFYDDEAPERLKPNNWQCRSCVFRTTCGNFVENVSPAEQDKGIPVDDEEFADALHHFCSWKEQEAQNSMPKAVKETWDSVGLRYFMRHGIDKLNGVENGEGIWNISLQDSGRETLNVEKVRYYLPPSIFQECFEKKPGKPYLVVRKARSKKGA